MGKYFIILLLLFGFKGVAQESHDQNVVFTQNAEFSGGDSAFSKELLKMIHAYIDLGKYAVNGQFVFVFDIGADGKISKLDVLPKVKNSEMFIDDMRFAISRIKKKWKPAIKEGKPVVSKKVIKINFTTDHFDHD
ncbi:hypothetical protein HNP38_002352 [Chryseobacterium defluvii]|uniref:TonB-like protein n=1 Tax=Chryseobacterium defluvii TaxID=160396 RepID=A0A840KGA3_9FLAO|nr:hypothetical protein [Chryseobacterium defluvii]MBB4807048.1 hypothetical protein [Chryseobacterium defluvii]